MNIGSLFTQLLLPTYMLERLTGSGKRIVAVVVVVGGSPFEETSVVGVVSTLTPFQYIWTGPSVSARLARDCTTAT